MDLLTLLDEVQAIARSGLHYSEDPFDRERYQRLLDIAVREYSEQLDIEPERVRARFALEVGTITPKVGADAAIFDDQNRILLVRRADDGRWGLVAGWVEAGEHPAATVVREAKEEVGLDVVVDKLAGVHHRRAGDAAGPHSAVSVVYLCSVVGGSMSLQPHEVLDARYRAIDEVSDWHLNHEELASLALAARR